MMIVFVVLLHAAVTYSGFGGWYYIENKQIDFASSFFFGLFQSHLQAFFMALLFLISGYFAAVSLQKRGAGNFIKARLIRLGIPTLIYILILDMLTVKFGYPQVDILERYVDGFKSLKVLGRTGPMWFAAALLIFSLIYVLIKKLLPKVKPLKIQLSWKNTVISIFIITAFAFLLRLGFPIGGDVLNFQLGHFSAYIIFFILGIVAFNNNLFNTIDYKTGKKYLLLSFMLGFPLWLVIILLGGPSKGIFLIHGGLNWQAITFAIWESFFCVTFSFALIGLFKHRFNSKGKLKQFMSDNAFGVYVFHPPILVGLSMIFKGLSLPPVFKFLFISAIVIPACFLIAAGIRKIPLFRKIFS